MYGTADISGDEIRAIKNLIIAHAAEKKNPDSPFDFLSNFQYSANYWLWVRLIFKLRYIVSEIVFQSYSHITAHSFAGSRHREMEQLVTQKIQVSSISFFLGEVSMLYVCVKS